MVASAALPAEGQVHFAGPYAVVEGGAISYNTQITFDGVDDPAGRGGAGFGAAAGFRWVRGRVVFGPEIILNQATVPDPYTFDAAAVGFSELDLRRALSFGADFRLGVLLAGRVLPFAALGLSVNHQSERVDGTSLEDVPGGASPETFGAVQFGAGAELAFSNHLRARFVLRSLKGIDRTADDFGRALNPALNRFDVEPRQIQFFSGMVLQL